MAGLRYGTGEEITKAEEAAGISEPKKAPAPASAPVKVAASAKPVKPKTFKAGKLYPLSSITESEGSRSNEPANGSYEHNSPAKPL